MLDSLEYFRRKDSMCTLYSLEPKLIFTHSNVNLQMSKSIFLLHFCTYFAMNDVDNRVLFTHRL